MNCQIITSLCLIQLFIASLFAGDTTMIKNGDIAPDFSLVSAEGDTVVLSKFAGKKYVVLIFYPGDETPGCTKQLCSVRDDYTAFEKKNAVVFGINPGNKSSHKKFIGNHGFQFTLLVDDGRKTAKAYGCLAGPLVKRTVFVIDLSGKVIFAQRGMPSNIEILKAIS